MMMEDELYTFHISAYTPETIPMARLAEYMSELAAIFGERDRVHFLGLKPGSTQVLSRVEREAAPKVRDNVAAAVPGDDGDGPAAFKHLNEMLRKDNADAQLLRNGNNVLTFPGYRAVRPPKLGPFTQAMVKDGVLVRIGGKDKSAHAIIADASGCTWSFEVSRDLARDMAHHLFGKPLRLWGQGRWFRDEHGEWQYSSLKASEFSVLDDSSLADVVNRIRHLPRDTWKEGIDATEMLRLLRDDNDGVN